jgi:DNA repair exonuclease SbcCD ATPase subunit
VARWLTELCEARERLKELEAQLASLRAALEQHRVDLHEYSSRPCPTCRKSAEALGLKGLPDTCAPRRLAEAREGK